MLMIFALFVIPVTFVVGAVAVDASLWQSERRGAQKDADMASLAGAYELFDQSAGQAAVEQAAKTATANNANANDEAGNAGIIGNIEVDNTCFNTPNRLDSVIVNVSHESGLLFGGIIGGIVPDIGAHARACMGSVISTTGLRPYGIESQPVCLSNGTCEPPADEQCFELRNGIMVPKFGEWCQLDDGSLDPSTSERGLLDLSLTGTVCSDGGRDDIDDNVQDGSNATCRIGDIVQTTTGARPGQDINRGVQVLLAGGGTPGVADGADCDKETWGNRDGIDNFNEVVERVDGGTTPSPDAVYQLRDCQSPRVISLIVVDNFDNNPIHIVGFAAFYILGCKMPNQVAQNVLPNKCATGAPGQLQLWGIFFNKVELEGDIGVFNPFGTHKIALVE
jgi:hypothetical protein